MKPLIQSWEKFKRTLFPENIAGKEIKGIDIVLLDTETAGCIATFITRNGALDKQRARILEKCVSLIKIVLEDLDPSAREYFSELLSLAEKVRSYR